MFLWKGMERFRILLPGKGYSFNLSLLVSCPCNQVRDWVSILPQSVTLKNAYRDRKAKRGEEQKKVPQSFTFIPREGHTRCQNCFNFHVVFQSGFK